MTVVLELPPAERDDVAARASTMGQRVFEALRQGIVQLRLRPGHQVSEAEVARQLGVSRQPVREAFIKLAEAGLVEDWPQRGTLVSLISRREVENARFLREAIEVAVARKAATDAGDEAIAAIRATLPVQKAAHSRGDVAGFLRADDALHQAVARAAAHEHAWRVLEGLKVQMDRVRYLSMPLATPITTLIEQHEEIVAAIAARDADAAEAAVKVHLSEILRSLPRIYEAHMAMFTD